MQRLRIHHKYDPAMDPTTWGREYNPSLWRKPEGVQAAFAQARRHTGQLRSKRIQQQSRQRERDRELREAAEARAADAVRAAVATLEAALLDLRDTPTSSAAGAMVNQLQVAKALFFLKTKCGIRFDGELTLDR